MDIRITKNVAVDIDLELHDVVSLIRQNTAPLDRIYILSAASEQVEEGDIKQIKEAGFGNKESFKKMADRLREIARYLEK